MIDAVVVVLGLEEGDATTQFHQGDCGSAVAWPLIARTAAMQIRANGILVMRRTLDPGEWNRHVPWHSQFAGEVAWSPGDYLPALQAR
jgi:hypothetical protein